MNWIKIERGYEYEWDSHLRGNDAWNMEKISGAAFFVFNKLGNYLHAAPLLIILA